MVTRTSEAAAVPATFSPPLTLQRLLDTEQATAILPGILYFASTGQCLSTSAAAAAAAAASPAAAMSVAADAVPSLPSTTAALATAAATAALHDFYYKENPLFLGSEAGTRRSAAAKAANAIPTARAAVGQDAAFVSLRGIPPYLYRPFFADFGPLDMGCCVHFARRLCELLHSVTGVDVRASLAAGAFAPSSAATRKGTAGAAAPPSSGSPLSSPGITPTGTTGSAASSHQPPLPTAAAVAPVLVPTAGGVRRPVVICAGLDAQERVNTACLVGAFCVLCLGWSAAATWYRGFADIYPGFLAYRDASQGVSNYPLSLLDVWSGLEQGVALGMVNVDTFDLPAFWRSKAQDCSWIVPRRFLAMSSPQDDKPNRTAEVYARRLRPLGVRLVVRLNDNLYSPSPLLRLGIRHVDLPYPDGSVPSDATLLRFLQAVETHFGESVAPVSLREWWTVSASGPGASSTPASATASRPTSAATSRSGSVAAKRSASAGGVAPRHAPVLQPCSLMHSGTCRGMPATCTAVPPTPPVTATRGRTVSLPGKRPLSSRSDPTSTAVAAAEPGAEDAAGALAPGERGAVAVHCLAGLGRTGTMLAVYLMRHYGFTARAVIGWLRLCRPGSITGIQQQYLDAMERRLRPPPHMLASLQLDSANMAYGAAGGGGPRFVTFSRGGNASPGGLQTLTSRPGTTGASAGGGAGGDAHALLPMGPRRQDTPHPLVTGGAGFQTHGSVLADARPATATVIVNGHIKRGFSLRALTVSRGASEVGNDLSGFADLATWHNISGGGSAYDLMRLRNGSTQHSNGSGTQQQQQQQPGRRFSSTSSATLSFSTIRPEGAALDEVARMPVLGDAEVDKEGRSGSAATAAFGRSVTPTADDPDGHGGSASPRVGDYKYASTYFVAMEQAGVPPTSAMHQSAAAARDCGGDGGGGRSGSRPPPPPPAVGVAISALRRPARCAVAPARRSPRPQRTASESARPAPGPPAECRAFPPTTPSRRPGGVGC